MHKKCYHQKGGECWNLILMILCEAISLELYLISLLSVLHAQDFPKTMAMDVYCIVY